jgi:hypothetical protein|tara:strand:- start:4106 stop:4318 length:213 start_codon:yes stop_codon:yes gene_type:complete
VEFLDNARKYAFGSKNPSAIASQHVVEKPFQNSPTIEPLFNQKIELEVFGSYAISRRNNVFKEYIVFLRK